MVEPKKWTPGMQRGKPSGRRLPSAIADELGTAILRGRYLPGRTLAGEIEASQKLEVSRSAYREAVGILAAKGLVESRPKSGTTVSPVNHWHLLDPQVLGWAFRTEPDSTLVRSLFELRMFIEPEAAALAAERRSYAHLAVMQSALKAMGDLGLKEEEGRDADRLFHQTILEATSNVFLISLSPGIAAAIHWTTVYKMRSRSPPLDSHPAHVEVFDAIRGEDPVAARSAMRALVKRGLDDTKVAVAAQAAAKAEAEKPSKQRGNRTSSTRSAPSRAR